MKLLEKIHYLIENLSEDKRQTLIKLANSPLSTSPQCATLIEYLVHEIANERQIVMKDVDLFKIIYPNQPFSQSKIYRLLKNTHQLVEVFYVNLRIDLETSTFQVVKLESYIKNGAYKYVKEELDEIWEKRLQTPLLDREDMLENLKFANMICWEHTKNGNFLTPYHVELFTSSLNIFNLISRLEFCHSMLNAHKLNNVPIPFEYVDETLAMVEKSPDMKDHILGQVLVYIVKMIYYNTDYSQELTYLLEKYEPYFNTSRLGNIYTFIRVFYGSRIRSGQIEYLEKIITLFKKSLDKGFLYDGVLLPTRLLIVYFNYGFILPETAEETFAYGKKHLHKILPEHQKDVWNIAEAYYAFVNGSYNKALKKLSTVKLQDTATNVTLRRLMLKSYYKQQDETGLTDSINSFRVYLQRNKSISSVLSESNRNFISIIRYMADFEKLSAAQKQKIEVQLSEHPVSERIWLRSEWEKRKNGH